MSDAHEELTAIQKSMRGWLAHPEPSHILRTEEVRQFCDVIKQPYEVVDDVRTVFHRRDETGQLIVPIEVVENGPPGGFSVTAPVGVIRNPEDPLGLTVYGGACDAAGDAWGTPAVRYRPSDGQVFVTTDIRPSLPSPIVSAVDDVARTTIDAVQGAYDTANALKWNGFRGFLELDP